MFIHLYLTYPSWEKRWGTSILNTHPNNITDDSFPRQSQSPTPPPSPSPNSHFTHSCFHLNVNSLLKGTRPYSNNVISDQLHSNITQNKIVSLVDTRLNQKGAEYISNLYGKDYHVFSTYSNLSPPSAETFILISGSLTNKIFNHYSFKLDDNDGHRAQAILIFDPILNEKYTLYLQFILSSTK